jgi:hypothetical protein
MTSTAQRLANRIGLRGQRGEEKETEKGQSNGVIQLLSVCRKNFETFDGLSLCLILEFALGVCDRIRRY